MAGTPRGTQSARSESPETLAETLFYLSDVKKRLELEEYRLRFEAEFGPTDLTRRYTSTWPQPQQDWLIKYDIKRWFDGLPSFAKAFLRGKLEVAARKGTLDNMPDNLLRLYLSREMVLDHETHSR